MDALMRRDIMRAIDRATRMHAALPDTSTTTIDTHDLQCLLNDLFFISGFAMGASPLEDDTIGLGGRDAGA
ncbi:hypothetical protein [Paraburkholderia youngii]|uniref:hypothetical protein n=1 Tax=Paraburkholderia youngii TaxID=2782701 RepID=UPI003D1DA5C3